MSETKKAKVKGLDVLLLKPEPFTIGANTFTMRMLGIKDTFTLIRLLKSAFQMGFGEAKTMIGEMLKELNLIISENGEARDKAEEKKVRYALMLAPILGITDVDFLIMDFFGDVVKEIVDGEELDVDIHDVSKFPAGSELVILANLSCHPSIEAYKVHFSQAKEKSPALLSLAKMAAGVPLLN